MVQGDLPQFVGGKVSRKNALLPHVFKGRLADNANPAAKSDDKMLDAGFTRQPVGSAFEKGDSENQDGFFQYVHRLIMNYQLKVES
jgi:hypothetical protein